MGSTSKNKKRSQNDKGGGSAAKKTNRKRKDALTGGTRRKKVEVSFDIDERREYLTGFSKRKKARRVFGLAMQKVKDRKDRLEERKERREAKEDRIQELERQRKIQRGEKLLSDSGSESDSADDGDDKGTAGGVPGPAGASAPVTTTYASAPIHDRFGGCVVVTTTPGLPPDSDDEANARYVELRDAMAQRKGVDADQRKLNSATAYTRALEGSLPGKKKSQKKWSGKGMHGAQHMKGMGGATGVKSAKKVLSRVSARMGVVTEERTG
eukprot:CAMPEP_0194267458 /NCGR_PEP_ID=MMETSP0169-20130528/1946_1 /TAXON_ID=218684 /ORGANISM="Corethron pennatum, Strain L29A3" /LENGTH=267 /DNA_ID=CAMNT_0039008291 /DNA_START=102 /DNA_END=901 /DNA_ORIENTATION=+